MTSLCGDILGLPTTGGEAGREFLDHMSAEGATSHIPTIILIMYSCIAAWSYLAHVVTGCSIYNQFGFYLAGMFAFYVWHTLAHSEFTGEMYQIHMEHHLERRLWTHP